MSPDPGEAHAGPPADQHLLQGAVPGLQDVRVFLAPEGRANLVDLRTGQTILALAAGEAPMLAGWLAEVDAWARPPA